MSNLTHESKHTPNPSLRGEMLCTSCYEGVFHILLKQHCLFQRLRVGDAGSCCCIGGNMEHIAVAVA
jgi:hypothetical protein